MKRDYSTPVAQAVSLAPRSSVLLNVSNEGYDVDPMNPGFVMAFESYLITE